MLNLRSSGFVDSISSRQRSMSGRTMNAAKHEVKSGYEQEYSYSIDLQKLSASKCVAQDNHRSLLGKFGESPHDAVAFR